MKSIIGAGVFGAAVAFAVSAGAMHHETIVGKAQATEDLSTLVTAVEAAGLVETLQGDGPFTVFAPTNAAFDALPDGTLDSLLADTDQLSGVLTYHVVSGEVMSDALTGMIEDGEGEATVETVQGGMLTASIEGGNVMIMDAAGNAATVTTADVEASNGVVHIIDTVLLPQ